MFLTQLTFPRGNSGVLREMSCSGDSSVFPREMFRNKALWLGLFEVFSCFINRFPWKITQAGLRKDLLFFLQRFHGI